MTLAGGGGRRRTTTWQRRTASGAAWVWATLGLAGGGSGELASRDGRPGGPSGLGVPGLAGGAAELGGEAVSEFALDPGLVPAVAGGEADKLVPLRVVAQDDVDG